MLWSAQRSVIPLTIATAVTPSRLSALEAQCASWRGPLAAALYLPLEAAAGKVQDESAEGSPEQHYGLGALSAASEKLLQEAETDAREVFER